MDKYRNHFQNYRITFVPLVVLKVKSRLFEINTRRKEKIELKMICWLWTQTQYTSNFKDKDEGCDHITVIWACRVSFQRWSTLLAELSSNNVEFLSIGRWIWEYNCSILFLLWVSQKFITRRMNKKSLWNWKENHSWYF